MSAGVASLWGFRQAVEVPHVSVNSVLEIPRPPAVCAGLFRALGYLHRSRNNPWFVGKNSPQLQVAVPGGRGGNRSVAKKEREALGARLVDISSDEKTITFYRSK